METSDSWLQIKPNKSLVTVEDNENDKVRRWAAASPVVLRLLFFSNG